MRTSSASSKTSSAGIETDGIQHRCCYEVGGWDLRRVAHGHGRDLPASETREKSEKVGQGLLSDGFDTPITVGLAV